MDWPPRSGREAAAPVGMGRVARWAVVVAAATFLVPGLWAFFWPASFHEHVAMFEPFNLHLLHDVGAFQIGGGVALVATLVWRDAVSVALLAAATGASAHALSHVVDRHLGGRPGDPWLLGVLALVLVAPLLQRRRTLRSASSASAADRSEQER